MGDWDPSVARAPSRERLVTPLTKSPTTRRGKRTSLLHLEEPHVSIRRIQRNPPRGVLAHSRSAPPRPVEAASVSAREIVAGLAVGDENATVGMVRDLVLEQTVLGLPDYQPDFDVI